PFPWSMSPPHTPTETEAVPALISNTPAGGSAACGNMRRSDWTSTFTGRATGKSYSILETNYQSLKMNKLHINFFSMKSVRLIGIVIGLLATVGAYGQANVTVAGNVVDENRQPFAGVTVFVGRPLRALGTTDENG